MLTSKYTAKAKPDHEIRTVTNDTSKGKTSQGPGTILQVDSQDGFGRKDAGSPNVISDPQEG
jgi:hypothetical protein